MLENNDRLGEEEDMDIKIAGAHANIVPDDGELAAIEFSGQKHNGNITRAYALGKRFAGLLFTTDDVLAARCCKKYAANSVIRSNAQVLFAFIVDTVLEHDCPNSVIAQTALNHFHEQVQAKSPETYTAILDSGAFSLYLLCSRDAKVSRDCIGSAFADGCDMESDNAVVKLGEDLYAEYVTICKAELGLAGFVAD